MQFINRWEQLLFPSLKSNENVEYECKGLKFIPTAVDISTVKLSIRYLDFEWPNISIREEITIPKN
ncbi:hypothetical protein T06_921 [Trichinella sp. T6]|nr:hypothetical protein T06_921 [Trichinella sp. T6]